MPTFWPVRMRAARLRQRLEQRRLRSPDDLIREHVSGSSFADIGTMWKVHGRMAFLAEESGASRVTAVDVMAPSAVYEEEHARRNSQVRFLHADINDPQAAEAIGVHDVVWCSGVLYHSPNPLLTLERLRSITSRVLLLATETMPEVPGLAQACVFWPMLPERDRRLHGAARPWATAVGVDIPFERDQQYSAWWWGISPTALHAMLGASGFTVQWEQGGPLHRTVVATAS